MEKCGILPQTWGDQLKELGERFEGLPYLVEVEEADEELESLSLVKQEEEMIAQMENVGMTDENVGKGSESTDSK
eukprot:2036272-Karenia_brevis.AAC.1